MFQPLSKRIVSIVSKHLFVGNSIFFCFFFCCLLRCYLLFLIKFLILFSNFLDDRRTNKVRILFFFLLFKFFRKLDYSVSLRFLTGFSSGGSAVTS